MSTELDTDEKSGEGTQTSDPGETGTAPAPKAGVITHEELGFPHARGDGPPQPPHHAPPR